MALFQKKPIGNELSIPYTLSINNDTILVVGLGNPEDKYKNTRHNIGFKVIDTIAHNHTFDDFKLNKKYNSLVSENNINDTKIILLKPQAYMNESGTAVHAISSFYKIPVNRIVVIHDELSIEFGQIRTRIGGQSAGHNGIKSIINHLGTDFGRIRIGIKNKHTPTDNTSNFVLANFDKNESENITKVIAEASQISNEFFYSKNLPHDTRNIINI